MTTILAELNPCPIDGVMQDAGPEGSGWPGLRCWKCGYSPQVTIDVPDPTTQGLALKLLNAPLAGMVKPGVLLPTPAETQGGNTLDDGHGTATLLQLALGSAGYVPFAPSPTGVAATDTANLAAFYGKACKLQPGTYLVNGLVCTGGEDWDGPSTAIVKLANNINLPVIVVANGTRLRNFTIDANGVNNTVPGAEGNDGIYGTGCSGGEIVDVTVKNAYGGGIFFNSVSNFPIRRVNTTGNGGACIGLDNCSYCPVEQPVSVADAYGVYIYGGSIACDVLGPIVEGLTGTNAALAQGGGINLIQAVLSFCRGGISEGHGSLRGVQIFESTSCGVIGTTVNGCGLTNPIAGFDIDTSTDCIIDDCIATGNGGSGFIVGCTSGNMTGTLTNCRSYNNGKNATASVRDGITLNGGNNVGGYVVALFVNNNTCYDNQGIKTQRYGIQEWQATAAMMRNIIGVNILDGNAVANTLMVVGGDVGLYAAQLSANTGIAPSNQTTIMTTATLPAGTYRVSAQVLVHYAAAGAGGVFAVAAGTATATFLGPQSQAVAPSANNLNWFSIALETVVVITAAGTLIFDYNNADGVNTATAEKLDFAQSLPATGYVIERVQ